MTETQWLEGTDLRAMLLHIAEKASMRQARLFAVACCRRAWDHFVDVRSREAVQAVELLADGLADEEDLEAVVQRARDATDPGQGRPCYSLEALHTPHRHASVAASWAIRSLPDQIMMETARQVARAVGMVAVAAADPGLDLHAVRRVAEEGEADQQRHLLCDIFRNPFRAMPAVPTAALPWNDGCIVKLAAGIYEERVFTTERMGVLADAMEEAGVTDEDVLGHCRQGGVHVRGCWLVDLLLDKE